jgi:N-acetyl-gamma-glutamylphosphate reductase
MGISHLAGAPAAAAAAAAATAKSGFQGNAAGRHAAVQLLAKSKPFKTELINKTLHKHKRSIWQQQQQQQQQLQQQPLMTNSAIEPEASTLLQH